MTLNAAMTALAMLQAGTAGASSSARIEAALGLWGSCAMGEAARLTLSPIPLDQIATVAFERCADIEAFARTEVRRSPDWNEHELFEAYKRVFRTSIEEIAEARRLALVPI